MGPKWLQIEQNGPSDGPKITSILAYMGVMFVPGRGVSAQVPKSVFLCESIVLGARECEHWNPRLATTAPDSGEDGASCERATVTDLELFCF